MTYVRIVLLTALLVATITVTAAAQGELTDPYEILNRHFEAVGGLDQLKAVQTEYVEGAIAVAGLQGTLKGWDQKPDRSRADMDLGILKITEAHNGDYRWRIDQNGKLQRITNPDEAAIKRREIELRMAEYEYADPLSDIFSATFEGIESIEGRDCYKIRLENSINDDVSTSYINVESFLLEKTVSIQGEGSNDTYFGDYREVDGRMVEFWRKSVDHQTGQAMEVTITKYIANLEIDPAVFEPPEQTGKDYRFVKGNSSEDVRFRFMGNHLFIPVTVGSKERLWVLDTGAAMSVINEEFADSLGLELQGDIKGRGAGGTVDIKLTTLPAFSVQGIDFDEQNVAVIDMKELVRAIGVDIAGILGYDFLSRFVTRIDYANELVSFYGPESFEYSGDGRELDVHLRHSVFMVKASLDGDHSGIWLFDLGASTVSLDGAYALRHGFTKKEGVERIARGAANAFRTKLVRCESIELAGFTVDYPKVSFSYGGTDTISTADEIGILGNTLFRHFVIYCDYANERVILEKGSDFGKEFPEDRSGLQVVYGEDGKVEVLFVASGTPAAKAGFQEGDVLKSVNGIAVEHLDGLIAIRKMLEEDPNTEYAFTVERDGDEKRLKLRLARLL
jgi:predicted aspartyl protease